MYNLTYRNINNPNTTDYSSHYTLNTTSQYINYYVIFVNKTTFQKYIILISLKNLINIVVKLDEQNNIYSYCMTHHLLNLYIKQNM